MFVYRIEGISTVSFIQGVHDILFHSSGLLRVSKDHDPLLINNRGFRAQSALNYLMLVRRRFTQWLLSLLEPFFFT
jgi:hypothetical protein